MEILIRFFETEILWLLRLCARVWYASYAQRVIRPIWPVSLEKVPRALSRPLDHTRKNSYDRLRHDRFNKRGFHTWGVFGKKWCYICSSQNCITVFLHVSRRWYLFWIPMHPNQPLLRKDPNWSHKDWRTLWLLGGWNFPHEAVVDLTSNLVHPPLQLKEQIKRPIITVN